MTKLKLHEGQKAVFIFRESHTGFDYKRDKPNKEDTTGRILLYVLYYLLNNNHILIIII